MGEKGRGGRVFWGVATQSHSDPGDRGEMGPRDFQMNAGSRKNDNKKTCWATIEISGGRIAMTTVVGKSQWCF